MECTFSKSTFVPEKTKDFLKAMVHNSSPELWADLFVGARMLLLLKVKKGEWNAFPKLGKIAYFVQCTFLLKIQNRTNKKN